MAGQAQRGSRGPGRSSHRASSARPVAAATTAASAVTPTRSVTEPSTGSTSITEPPATRSLYRLLQMKGLSPVEAANLTAFMCGLPATGHDWSLRQVNLLLFLRQMNQTGRFGRTDGKANLQN
jgi:hypothetical protein